MYYIKQNDRRPPFEATIKRGGVVVPLDTATSVTFKMRLDGGDGSLKVESGAVITDAPNGVCEYRPYTGDTDTPGLYLAEWEVLWNDGTTETFPTVGFDYVLVEGEL